MTATAESEIRVDAEFRRLIPPLSQDERAQLEANIVRDGVLDPIKVWNGVILDGHNRYEIAEAHGFDYDIDEFDLADRGAAKVWIIQHQLGRRNLTAFSRTELATQLEGILAAQAKERQGRRTDLNPDIPANLPEGVGETREQVAKVAGVSARTVSAVKSIQKAAAEGKVDEETIDKLRAGEVSINAVAKQVKPPKAKSQAQKEREKAAAIMAKQDAEAEADDEDEWEEVDDDLPDSEALKPLSEKRFEAALDVLHRKAWDLIERCSADQLVRLRMELQTAERTTAARIKEVG